MTTVTGFTAPRMLAIEAATVVSGTVNGSGHLILTKNDGTTVDAGSVIGPTGPTGPAASKTFRIPHTFTIPGIVSVPSGDTDYVPGMFVDLPAGQTATISLARARINSGTSATVQLKRNGTGICTATAVTTTSADIAMTSAPVALADNDYLQIVVSIISGTPKNLSFTAFIDYTV